MQLIRDLKKLITAINAININRFMASCPPNATASDDKTECLWFQ